MLVRVLGKTAFLDNWENLHLVQAGCVGRCVNDMAAQPFAGLTAPIKTRVAGLVSRSYRIRAPDISERSCHPTSGLVFAARTCHFARSGPALADTSLESREPVAGCGR